MGRRYLSPRTDSALTRSEICVCHGAAQIPTQLPMIRGGAASAAALLACLCIAAFAVGVQSAPPPLPRACPSSAASYPEPLSVPYQNANDDELYSGRTTPFDVPNSGVAYRTLFPTALNSEFLVSWSSNAPNSSTFAEHDTMAWRVYAEEGTTGGITPPSLSAAWYSNASNYAFTYNPLGFVAGNVDAGAWSVIQTLSVLGAFEFNDANQNGRFDEGVDSVESTQDLASVAWDKPCTSAGRGDDSVTPDSGFNSFVFTNVMYAPARPLRLTIVVEQSANPANGSVLSTQDGVGADGADNLLLSPRNVLFTVTLEGYPFVSPHNLLALNVSHLASRGDAVPNLDFTQLSAWDLSGQSGIGASALNRALNTSDPADLAMVNALGSVATSPLDERSNSYLVWNRPGYDAGAGGLSLSTWRRINAGDMPGTAARMFLASSAPSTQTVAHNFILSGTDESPSSVSVSFSVGFGDLVLPPRSIAPDDSPSNDTALIIGLASGGGVLILVFIACCVCRTNAAAAAAKGGKEGYASLESEDAAWRRKQIERQAAERHAAAIAHARSPSPPSAIRAESPHTRANTQSGLESNASNHVVSSLGHQAYSPSEPSRLG